MEFRIGKAGSRSADRGSGDPVGYPEQMAVDSRGALYFLQVGVKRWDGTRTEYVTNEYVTGVAIDAADRVLIASPRDISIGGTRIAGRGQTPNVVDPLGPALFANLGALAASPAEDLVAGQFRVGDDGRLEQRYPRLNPGQFAVDEAGNGYELAADSSGQWMLRKEVPFEPVTASAWRLDGLMAAPRVVAARGGGVYAMYGNAVIRIDSEGTVTILAGQPGAAPNMFSGDGGPAREATLNLPRGMTFDAEGNLYIADTMNNRIRKVDATGTITTVAGSPLRMDGYNPIWFCGDGGAATEACLHEPAAVAVDREGKLYIADTLNQRVRAVGPDGVIRTVAGRGACEISGGDGKAAQDACLKYPAYLQLGAGGQIYVGEGTARVRKLALAVGPAPEIGGAYKASAWEVLTIAGTNLALTEAAAGPPNPPPYRLAGSAVSVIDSIGVEQAALLTAAAPDRLAFIVPAGLKPGAATIKVRIGDGREAIAPLILAPR